MDFFTYMQNLEQLKEQGAPFVQVTVVSLRGPNPAPVGAKMLVTDAGLYAGTIGGGKVEKRALEEAHILIKEKSSLKNQLITWNLNRDLGMSCGGEMSFFFELFMASDHRQWEVAIFGAGHVAQALVRVLLPLDCRIAVFDSRRDWLDKFPLSSKLRVHCVEDLASQVEQLAVHSFVLLMTQGHASDFPVLKKILNASQPFSYLGVIGSGQKRRKLTQELLAQGLSLEQCESFHCPMGKDFGNNSPQEIALSITAELIEYRDR